LSFLQATVLSHHDTIEDLKKIHAEQIIKKDQIDTELRQFSDEKTEHTRIVERHHSLVKEIEGLIHQKDLVGSQVADLALLEQEYRELEQVLSEFPDKKKRLDSFRILKTDFDRLVAENWFAERSIADLDQRLGKMRAKIGDLDADAATIQALCISIRKNTGLGDEISDDMLEQAIVSRNGDILHTIKMLTTQQNTLAEEWKSLLSNWETIKNAGPDGTCPLCHQTLGSHYARIEQEFRTQIEALENQALRVCEGQERMTNEKERIDRELPFVNRLRGLLEKQRTRDLIESELKELISLRDGREREWHALQERIRELGFNTEAFEYAVKEIADLERIQGRFIDLGNKVGQGAVWRKQVSDLSRQINQKQADLAELSALITHSSFDPEAGAQLDYACADINSAIRTTETEIARTTERLLNAEEKIDTHKKAEEQITLLQQKIDVLKEDTNLLRLTRSVISDYVVYLMQVVRSRIESEVSNIISEITGGRYERILLDEDFNLLVRDIDNDYPIDRFSGGEQDDIAVALRIALSRYLAELHQMHDSTLLIFDEIFGSQDEERRTNLLTALRTQESRFPQIILISHISELQGEFTSTLIVEMGADLASRVRGEA
ncbi:MAG: hypothetical protein LUP99_05920, partial [Methanomicrobiales archaeon]|nr:hypothetical protein [Methanomicrobiales archaeon]